MRILFCNYEYPPLGGGGGVVNAMLAEELAKRHPVTILTSQAQGLPRESVENDVRVVRVPVLGRRKKSVASMVSMLCYVLFAPRVGRKLLQTSPQDVINTHFVLPSGPVGNRLSRAHGLPNVLSVHGGDLYDPSKFMSPHRHVVLRSWIRSLVRKADSVVGQSNNTLDNLRQFYTPEAQGALIPLGIKRPPAGEAAREKYGIGPDEVVLVTLGRIIARKAVNQLIEAIDRMRDTKASLLVLGTGPKIPELEEDARARGIADRVRFLGNVEEQEKFDILRMSDLFVSTSQHEGFGLVFLEAMACGLPVACYDHGGQSDFLTDGETGPFVKLNELETFVERCRGLVENRDERKRMGQQNLGLVEEYFIERCAEKYERIFEELARSRRQASA